mmetsp:Transcript_136189/g.303349  ORF Transcript_136189/g.303349 Transcript_136189/m.303349 type:complete len:642 (-) Transcript_136189:12-1937(-)
MPMEQRAHSSEHVGLLLSRTPHVLQRCRSHSGSHSEQYNETEKGGEVVPDSQQGDRDDMTSTASTSLEARHHDACEIEEPSSNSPTEGAMLTITPWLPPDPEDDEREAALRDVVEVKLSKKKAKKSQKKVLPKKSRAQKEVVEERPQEHGESIEPPEASRILPDRLVFFDNLLPYTTEDHLREEFEQAGAIASFGLYRGKDGESLGKGFCEYFTVDAAERALRDLGGSCIDGRSMLLSTEKTSAGLWLWSKPASETGSAKPRRLRWWQTLAAQEQPLEEEDGGYIAAVASEDDGFVDAAPSDDDWQEDDWEGCEEEEDEEEEEEEEAEEEEWQGEEDTWEGCQEEDPCRVFFDHVPARATEEHLREVFERAGRVTSLEIALDGDGWSLGRGSCMLDSAASAKRAVRELSGRYVLGRSMYVSSRRPRPRPRPTLPPPESSSDGGGWDDGWSRQDWQGQGWQDAESWNRSEGAHDPRRIFFKNASKWTSEGYLRAHFEKAGCVLEFEFWRQPDGVSLGMGCCQFDSSASAKRAIAKFDKESLDGSVLRVEQDYSPARNPAARVFFHNVAWTTTEQNLRKRFEAVGVVRAFELRVKWDGRSLGMGTCEYWKPRHAADAIKRLGGAVIDGRKIFVSQYGRQDWSD